MIYILQQRRVSTLEFRVYLGGAMQGLSFQDQNKWREYVKDNLESYYCDYRVKCINPVDYYNMFDSAAYDSDLEVMNFDLHKVKTSNIVIMNFNNMYSLGSMAELAIAYDRGIPVIGLNESERQLHSWQYCMCSKVFADRDAMLTYIKKYYLD